MIKELLYKEGIRGDIFPHREYRGCMANTLNAYIIGPEGELYKCWNDVTVPEAVVGNIADYGRKPNNRLLTFMTQANPFVSECKKCLVFPLCGGGCSYHRLRNIKENANFVLCSPYKDFARLKKSLFDGVKIEQIHQQQTTDL